LRKERAMEENNYIIKEDFDEYEQQKETEEDLHKLTDDIIRQAVVTSTDWTTETILSQINKVNILLNPQFQRRDAWTKKRKSKFIESLVLGLPVPQLVLAESADHRGKYIVIDGKQRLLSIRQFAASENDSIFEQLKLTGLEVRTDLNGKCLDDFNRELDFYDDLSSFENQPIRTVIIKNWPNEDFLYHVFLRLNTGSVTLSPQELRQALHPGAFVKFVDEESRDSSALRDILKSRKPDFRMRDAELLVRYYAFSYFLDEYKGNLKDFLDNTCEKLNDRWIYIEDQIRADLDEFESAHTAIKKVFGQHSYRKWTASGFESRFNRAIFDILIYSFRNSEARRVLEDNSSAVIDIFKELCENNKDFLSSIEQTTKSIRATHIRLSSWCNELNERFDLALHVPHFEQDAKFEGK